MKLRMIKRHIQMELEVRKSLGTAINGYHSVNHYFLENGMEYKSCSLSRKVRLFLDGLDLSEFKLMECFKNAQQLALLESDFSFTYVEGVAITTVGIPILHAWNVIDGAIVDLTYGPLGKVTRKNGSWYLRRRHRIFGIIPEGWEYLGVEISNEVIWSSIRAHGIWQSIVDDYECEWPVLRGVIGHNGR